MMTNPQQDKGMFAENVKTLMRKGMSQADAIRQAGSMAGGKGPKMGIGKPMPKMMASPSGDGMAAAPPMAAGTASISPIMDEMGAKGAAAGMPAPGNPVPGVGNELARGTEVMLPGQEQMAPPPAAAGAPPQFNQQLMEQLMKRMPGGPQLS